ncbi:MAG: M3 family metallopeptidase [Alistipes sp.]|nr:M3 family metallopeptidase [Alistipes sp.]
MKRLLTLSSLFLVMTMTLSCGSDVVNDTTNPLLEEWTTEFGIPPFDKIRTEHYAPAFEEAMKMHNEEIAAIVESEEEPTFENVILAMDNAGVKLYELNLIFGMLSSSDLDDEMQEVQNTMMPRIEEHYNSIMLNDKLFERVKVVYDKRKSLKLDELQMRLVEKTYNDFVRSGALLSGEAKERLMKINAELSELSIRFGNNLLKENGSFFIELNDEQVKELPEGVRNQAREAAEAMGKKASYVFTLDKPSMLPFLTYSKNRDLRRELYNGYTMRCNNDNEYDNKQLAEDMARLRVEKANLLGYKSYSHYVTADQMAGNPAAVYKLLEEVFEPALESAKRELEDMKEIFRKDFPGETFEKSDWWYYAEQVRKKKYQLDEEAVRQYLSLDNVRDGMFYLANRLYGITFRPIAAPRYHKECTVYEVLDHDQSHVGVLYLDPYPRKSKSGGAWCGNFTEQRYVDGERKAPVIGIVCNFTPPVGNTPSLLTFDEAETMFHEFGHALHFLFADVRYRGLTDVEGDFVELPSQIMENWAFEPEIMKEYAVHYRTGEVIPDNLIAKIQNASLFNQGFTTTELAAAALIDMDIHSLETYTDLDINDFEKYNLATRRGLIPEIEPRYRYTYFAHIFNGGYSSGYYFYLWAEVLDKDAFEAFKLSSDLCDKELARSFRYDLLAQGGQKPGMEMYRKFRGADPDKTAMLKARGLWQEPVVEEPILEEAQIEEPEIVKPTVAPERKPIVAPKRPTKPGEPIRGDITKKPIKK